MTVKVMGNPVRERVENIIYGPGVKNSSDLEAATKTITAVAEAVGVGNADYSWAVTMAIPTDTRLAILNIGSRLSITVDSYDTATHLYCRVYVDSQDANHRLFDLDLTPPAANALNVQDLGASTKATIFNLLKDGAAHTFYFFFWVDQAVNAVISLVNAWFGVGTTLATGDGKGIMSLVFTGLVQLMGYATRVGTGTFVFQVTNNTNEDFGYGYAFVMAASANAYITTGTSGTGEAVQLIAFGTQYLRFKSQTVVGDLCYLNELGLNLRSIT